MIETLRTVAKIRRARGFAIVTVIVAGLLQLSSLSNHLGFASALVAGLFGSFAAMVVGSAIPDAFRQKESNVTAGQLLASSSLYALSLVALLATITAIAGAIRAPCAPAKGALWWLLLAVLGPLVASCWGVFSGALVTKVRWASRLAGFTIPVFVTWSVLRFYRSPGVFAFDPFFGFWPGVLYDENIRLDDTILTYRVGTLGWIIALASALVAFWNVESRKLTRTVQSGPAAVSMLGGALLGLSIYFAGPSLGHRLDADDIAKALGGRIDGRRCSLVYSRNIGAHEARLHHRDCEDRVVQLERFFGVRMDGVITAFIFDSAGQKQRMMGAANTFIAKPWRGEVYLQHDAFPHPVLKHELAHVLARRFAEWPFYVTSKWGMPMPGLVEGAAVAAAFEGESDASPHEWTRAMLDAGLLPPLDEIMGSGFYGQASSTSYTAAGSFSRWLIDREGIAKFRDVYRDADFQRVYGVSLGALSDRWKAFLRSVEVPERIRVRARTRFRRASLFARACPHETAEAVDQSEVWLMAGDVSRARTSLERAVSNDPTNTEARAMLAEALVRQGDVRRAISMAEDAARSLGPSSAARVWRRIGQEVWRWRGADDARPLFRQANADLFDDDEARNIEVRQWALGLLGATPTTAASEATRDLLIGRGALEPDAVSAVAQLGRVFDDPSSDATSRAMAGYLTVRQLWRSRREREALSLAGRVVAEDLPSLRIRAEFRRVVAECRYHTGDASAAREGFRAISEDPARPTGTRDAARDWLDRLR
ncbi:MAG: tetratricopeptide repeat protein [Myxococcales bacterium]|nr:tetratricopeptide repeat protein [Myxococcales bacterium]